MAGLRIGGLATGLDTDTLVKQMMQPYTMKVDKMKQDRQIITWKQELYRDILSDTANISKTYFDILKPENNMLSKNTYAGFDVTSNNNVDGQSAGVTATTSLGAVAGSYKVDVERLAETAKIEGTKIFVNDSNSTFNLANWKGKTITFKNGEKAESITIGDTITDKASLIADINTKLGAVNTNLATGISVSDVSGAGIRFTGLSDSVKVVSTTVVDEMSNIINLNRYTTKLIDLGVTDGILSFQYNDSNGVPQPKKDITISKDTTISQLMDEINQGTSGAVKLNFSELTNEFSIESLQTGGISSLNVTGDGATNILTKLNLTVPVGGTIGIDAKITITPPGINSEATTVEKSGNNFSIDGINYSLSKLSSNNITVAGNTQKTYDKIKGFIDKYNELIDKVNQKTDEKKQYKFRPLTDEQRTDMSEDEIKQWEIKAKEGLLKSDQSLENMLNSMRSAFYKGVDGAGIYLSDIGLSTSADTSLRGKIIIDETKLKTAIETRGEQVANLFTKTSTTPYSPDASSDDKRIRNEEQGIFQRINDILQDYTRTTLRNSNGKRGILFEKAGMKGDQYKSLLSEDIIKKDEKINEMIRSLAAKENRFYMQFSRLEVAMNKLNSQSSWLTQQFSQGQ